jgi:hypothetical protein
LCSRCRALAGFGRRAPFSRGCTRGSPCGSKGTKT